MLFEGRVYEKLKRNPLFITGCVIFSFSVLISLGGAMIRPDSTPFANDQHLELSTIKPFTTVRFLTIPIDPISSDLNPMARYFVGTPATEKQIPFDSIWISGSKLNIRKFNQSKLMRFTSGDLGLDNDQLDLSNLMNERVEQRTFILGADKYGRDLLSRLMSGNYISLSVGFISVFISLVIGLFLGLTAGYYRGWSDRIIMWFINVIWSIPTLLLVIAITLVLGKGFWQIFIAVGLTMWVEVARVVRGQVMSVREKEYIEAGTVLGLSNSRIIFNHILPNVISPIIVISAANFATAILLEAGLSFLGIGAPPPQATWGKMIAEHKSYLITGDYFLAIIPGIAIMLLVLAFTFIGNGLRDAMDERLD